MISNYKVTKTVERHLISNLYLLRKKKAKSVIMYQKSVFKIQAKTERGSSSGGRATAAGTRLCLAT